MTNQVFYDPQRKRWKRLRRIFDILALSGLVIGVLFVIGLMKMKPLPSIQLSPTPRNYRALTEKPIPVLKPGQKLHQSAHRKTSRKPSDIPLNSGEGLRAAYYVEWDAASYSSLKQHIKQIDLLFPEWLHVLSADGSLTAYTSDNRAFAPVDASGVHGVDVENKVARAIAENRVDTEIFPLVNNYDPVRQSFAGSIGTMLNDPGARANFIQQVGPELEALPYLQRFAWFSNRPYPGGYQNTGLLDASGALTPVGQAYTAIPAG